MKEEAKCPYCQGTKVNVDKDEDEGNHYPGKCPQCKGSGKRKDVAKNLL